MLKNCNDIDLIKNGIDLGLVIKNWLENVVMFNDKANCKNSLQNIKIVWVRYRTIDILMKINKQNKIKIRWKVGDKNWKN